MTNPQIHKPIPLHYTVGEMALHHRLHTVSRAVAMVAFIGTALSLRATPFLYEGLYYNTLNEMEAEVCRPANGDSYQEASYEIPAEIEMDGKTYTVVGIGEKAFLGCSELHGISLPSTLTRIGEDAFNGCVSLGPELVFMENMTFGEGAFSYCRAIEELDLSAIEEISGDGVFMGCTRLSNVTFNDRMERIPAYTFKDCQALGDISLPMGLTELGAFSFAGCTSLPGIEIPREMRSIGEGAFSNCTGISGISFTCAGTELGEGAFENLTALESVYLTGVKDVGDGAFAGCRQMKWVEIDHGAETIGRRAFTGCASLESVYSHPAMPPVIYQDTFDTHTEETAWLIVPEGAFPVYGMAAYWSSFAHLAETSVFPVGVKGVEKEDALTFSVGKGEIYVECDERPHLHSLSGLSICSRKRDAGWAFPVGEGIYLLTGNGFRRKICVR